MDVLEQIARDAVKEAEIDSSGNKDGMAAAISKAYMLGYRKLAGSGLKLTLANDLDQIIGREIMESWRLSVKPSRKKD